MAGLMAAYLVPWNWRRWICAQTTSSKTNQFKPRITSDPKHYGHFSHKSDFCYLTVHSEWRNMWLDCKLIKERVTSTDSGALWHRGRRDIKFRYTYSTRYKDSLGFGLHMKKSITIIIKYQYHQPNWQPLDSKTHWLKSPSWSISLSPSAGCRTNLSVNERTCM